MSKFAINTKNIANQVQEEKEIIKELERILQKLEKIQKTQVLSSESYELIQKALVQIETDITDERNSVKNLYQSLEKIRKSYEDAEIKITETKIDKKMLGEIRKGIVSKIIETDWKKKITDNDFKMELEEWMKGFIPHYVSDEAVVAFLATLAGADTLSKELINKHFDNNEKAWDENKERYIDKDTGYIEHQNQMQEIQYGEYNKLWSDFFMGGRELTGDTNTCEVIAVYNALLTLNNGTSPETFPDLLAEFEKNGIVLEGYLGTAPSALQAYFESNQYSTKSLSGNNINSDTLDSLSKEYDTFIITTYNDKDNIMNMVHTMNITEEDGTYTIHNDYEGTKTYESLEAATYGYNGGEGEPISIIGIKK